MPCHPTHACYCHVIEDGHKNLARQIRAGDLQAAAHELVHIQAVTRILNDYLLYAPNDPRWSDSEHDKYWDVIRPAYMQKASPESILTYYNSWDFLAFSTRFDIKDELLAEERLLNAELSRNR